MDSLLERRKQGGRAVRVVRSVTVTGRRLSDWMAPTAPCPRRKAHSRAHPRRWLSSRSDVRFAAWAKKMTFHLEVHLVCARGAGSQHRGPRLPTGTSGTWRRDLGQGSSVAGPAAPAAVPTGETRVRGGRHRAPESSGERRQAELRDPRRGAVGTRPWGTGLPLQPLPGLRSQAEMSSAECGRCRCRCTGSSRPRAVRRALLCVGSGGGCVQSQG